ncbi:MAG: ferrochelatase [Gammaproteobacteria bacterium]|nr:ferrochelatase [Gammaproteobacteria bacterium]
MSQSTAVLLTNLGTPEALNKPAVRRFLKQFLSDRRVVEVHPVLWWLILNGIILPVRSAKTLQAYQRIWATQGSPLLVYAQKQQAALQTLIGDAATVAMAMRYGKPDFKTVIESLLAEGVNRLIFLPLYPQNSATTTATSFYHLADTLAHRRDLPSIHFIDNYHDHPAYINALAASVKTHWQQADRQNHLLVSFHGLPQANVDRGDPYYDQCLNTARLLTAKLELDESAWSLSFQSRFGKRVWLQPYTSDVLESLVNKGIKSVDVICPGFAADCLETLDEIKIEYRQLFMQHGGETFNYISALNDDAGHIEMMRAIVGVYLADSSSSV